MKILITCLIAGLMVLSSSNPSESYTATAYCLKGKTASGKKVTGGFVAADPRILPIGTRIRIDAGKYTGHYVVRDTGGKIKGKRLDVWVPTKAEAMRFGKRKVMVTVLK